MPYARFYLTDESEVTDMIVIKSIVSLLFLLSLLTSSGNAANRVIEIYPSNADGTCNEEFENVVNTLLPGDLLVLHGGIYSQTCRRLITGRNGTADAPIIVEAAAGERPVLTRPDNAAHSYPENNIEIENSSYLIIRGLGFRGGDLGVRFMGAINHITFEDNEVYETGANALALNSGNSDSMVLRRNHIHHTGLDTSSPTTGEGMYLGCNDNTCRITNSLIEGNYIHHLRSTSSGGNDGIEVKVGSYGNVIRDNVIHDTTIGTRYPCIFVYGGGPGLNIVEGNAVWSCGEGIYAVSDATVRNNIIFSSDTGISSFPHVQVSQMRNLNIVNNTIYENGECLYARWSSVTNAVLANNAIYCPGTTAVDASGFSNVQVVIRNNYTEGTLQEPALTIKSSLPVELRRPLSSIQKRQISGRRRLLSCLVKGLLRIAPQLTSTTHLEWIRLTSAPTRRMDCLRTQDGKSSKVSKVPPVRTPLLQRFRSRIPRMDQS